MKSTQRLTLGALLLAVMLVNRGNVGPVGRRGSG